MNRLKPFIPGKTGDKAVERGCGDVMVMRHGGQLNLLHLTMLSNYYKTAVRNIARHPFYTVLNVAGLALGIAFTLLIAIYCWSEWRVNRELRQAGRQYILGSDWKDP